MFPAEIYLSYFNHGLLALILLTALVYGQGSSHLAMATGYNAFMLWSIGALMVFFVGTRPIDGAFIDMTTYAQSFRITQKTGISYYPDWGFGTLVETCAKVMEPETFFLICTVLYIVPVGLGMRRFYGPWAFAGFIAIASSFSFFSYGVNGIRNGIATSLLIAAFAYADRRLWMLLLMVAAEGMHKSVLLPIAAFFIAGFYAQPWVYVGIWTGALGLAATFGTNLSNLIVGVTALGDDERLSTYTANAGFGGDRGGFRPDFVLYSIVPIAISYALASAQVKKDPFYRRLICTYLLANAFWLLVMYAAYSNRFAYLSWFMMPWVIMYPFIPRLESDARAPVLREEPRTALLGVALAAHFAFTYVMHMFVYSSRS